MSIAEKVCDVLFEMASLSIDEFNKELARAYNDPRFNDIFRIIVKPEQEQEHVHRFVFEKGIGKGKLVFKCHECHETKVLSPISVPCKPFHIKTNDITGDRMYISKKTGRLIFEASTENIKHLSKIMENELALRKRQKEDK